MRRTAYCFFFRVRARCNERKLIDLVLRLVTFGRMSALRHINPFPRHLASFQNELPFLVPLALILRVLVLPPHHAQALVAVYVAHRVRPGEHVSVLGGAARNVDTFVEQVANAVSASKGSARDVLRFREVRLAPPARVDATREVLQKRTPHGS